MEMDDLLDQLEMEVEQERITKRKEEQVSKECVKIKDEMREDVKESEPIDNNSYNGTNGDNLFIASTESKPVTLSSRNTNGKLVNDSESIDEDLPLEIHIDEDLPTERRIDDIEAEVPSKDTEISIEASFEKEEDVRPVSKIMDYGERLFDSANIQQTEPEIEELLTENVISSDSTVIQQTEPEIEELLTENVISSDSTVIQDFNDTHEEIVASTDDQIVTTVVELLTEKVIEMSVNDLQIEEIQQIEPEIEEIQQIEPEIEEIEEHQISISKETESNDEIIITKTISTSEPLIESTPETTSQLEKNEIPPLHPKNEAVLSNAAYEMAQSLLEEIGDIKEMVKLAKERKTAKTEEVESSNNQEEIQVSHNNQEETEASHNNQEEIETQAEITEPEPTEPKEPKKSVIMSTHAVGINVGNDLRLTESELQMGKQKPTWILDRDCKKCMLCSNKFTLVNRRHHCRCCGRVLCSECCSIRRSLPYMEQDERKQRVCSPCNSTLDRIELYEKAAESNISDTPTSSSNDPSSSSSSFIRKKSVLKTRTKSENDTTSNEQSTVDQPTTSSIRRNVKFLDGSAPGDEQMPTSPKQEVASQRSQGIFSSRPTRSSRSSRRSKDTMAKEENQRLDARWFYCCNDLVAGGLSPWRPAELFKRLEDNLPVRLILKRNIHVILQFTEYQEKKAYVLYTAGFNTLGVDELLIVFEKRPNEKDGYLPSNLIRSLMRYSEICLDPTTNLLDDKNGIRQCANRMSPLFELEPDETEHDAVALYFHPYQNQDLKSISHPNNGAFRVGIFVQESELALVKAMPSRFLHRLGMMTSVYPTPILNEIGRESTFEPFQSIQELTSSTILAMFHDFRNNSYQLPRINASYSLIRESSTQICLPVWAQDQIKRMAETNTNLLAWSLELSYQADSLFTCERIGQTFSTRIFMKSNTRETIGAAFVAFSTGHKGSDNGFTQTVVEDGIVIRLTSDGLENLLKRLSSGDDYILDNDGTSLEVKWIENEALSSYGSINSPIDGIDLRGFYQYGLLLNRAVHSNQVFYSDKMKALRLGSVISLNNQKIDPQIQSHFFDACEQLTLWLKTSLESYVHMLLGLEINQICVRIYASNDRVGYDLAQWAGLEEAYEEFLKILAEKVIPFLYNLLETTNMNFKAELHLPIISIEPLFTMNSDIPIRNYPYFSDSELVEPTSSSTSNPSS